MTILKSFLGCLALLMAMMGQAQKKQSLFNGKDLSGWTKFGTEKWYVEKGLLISESGPDKQYGYLATNEHFQDFELTLEFKQEADGNSGVFFRSTIDGTKITGWQVEVAPPGKHTGGIYESYGRGWLIRPDSSLNNSLKYGKWNKMKIRVKGGTVTTWLNGKQMISLTDEKIATGKGSIALQIHDGGGIKVYWRKISILKL